MKGYVSFILVFISVAVLIGSLALLHAARSTDLSGAIIAARAGGISQNVRECVHESAYQGASSGFALYDASHDVSSCRHCPDNFCTPPNPALPDPATMCDSMLCSMCFRSSEARAASETGAGLALMAIGPQSFDGDFSVRVGVADLEARLEPDAATKNGLRLSEMVFRSGLPFEINSDKFRFRGNSEISRGTVVLIGPDVD